MSGVFLFSLFFHRNALNLSKKLSWNLHTSAPTAGAPSTLKETSSAARCVKDKENKGLVLLHEELGNYTVAMSSTLQAETGDEFDFNCPICHSSLNSPQGEALASIVQIANGEESNIVMSRIFGERCTFQIDDKKKVRSYGESVSKFVDPDWFL